MEMDIETVTVTIIGGATYTVPFLPGMNAQNAMEEAYLNAPSGTFDYLLEYFGDYGYLVYAINGTAETADSSDSPYFYWEFLYNGSPATTGIDSTLLNMNDVIAFSFIQFFSLHPVSAGMKARMAKHQLNRAR
jgi:Domain of unknown function (DUF4430)